MAFATDVRKAAGVFAGDVQAASLLGVSTFSLSMPEL